MLLRLKQVARLSLVFVLLPLKNTISRAAPCLDLYEGVSIPILPHCSVGMPYSTCSLDQLCNGSVIP